MQAVLSNAANKSSTLRKAVVPEGGLKVTRPVGRIDPNPGVPPEPTTKIALHRGKSLTLVGVVLDLPKRPLRMETTRAEVVAIAVLAKVHVSFT